MAIRIRKVHKSICVCLWIAWAIGVLLLLLDLLLNGIQNGITHEIFYRLIKPYISSVMLLSLLPIEPLALIVSLIQDFSCKEHMRTILISVCYFAVTVVFWLAFIGLNILLTGI